MNKEIAKLKKQSLHQVDGYRIIQGMPKPGNHDHIHIMPTIPFTQAQLEMKVVNRLRRMVEVAIKSNSIGI